MGAFAQAWPWMGKPKRPSALMHTGLARWRRDITSLSSSVMGRHGKVVWEWAQAEWRAPYSARDREQGKEPPAPVKVWVLSLLLEDGSDLHWGHVHPVAWRHGSKLPRNRAVGRMAALAGAPRA